MHIVRGCVGFEVLIDVLAHMFDRGAGFSLASCVRGRLLRLEMLSHSVYGHLLFQLCMGLLSNGEEACYYSHRWWGLFGKKDFEVERFDLPPLRGGGRRGKLFIVGSVKLWEIP